MHIIGQTIDDAAGETFDKAAKIMGLPYPGGPLVDKLAAGGDPARFVFARPSVPSLDFSFSGLKTSILYFLRDKLKTDHEFIEKNKADLCASIQKTILDILLAKLEKAALETGIQEIAIAGGVSANSGLRARLATLKDSHGWAVYVPPLAYTTDNAAMIAITGYLKYLKKDFASQSDTPFARGNF